MKFIAQTLSVIIVVIFSWATSALAFGQTTDPEDFHSWQQTSPDGKWTVKLTAKPTDKPEDCKTDTSLQLLNRKGHVVWTIFKKQIMCEYEVSASPVTWSPDSRYFYFTGFGHGGCGGCNYMLMGLGGDLFRLNVRHRRIERVLRDSWGFALSPDGKFLAYINATSHQLVLRNLQSGHERRAAIVGLRGVPGDTEFGIDVDVGQLVWNPNSQAFAFNILLNGCDDNATASVILVNAQTLGQRVLVEQTKRVLMLKDWGTNNGLIAYSFSKNSESLTRSENLRIDPETGYVSDF
jgi:WD40-like Beta Propeller Repeat